MRVSRPKISLLLSLLLILFSITITARADDEEADDYDVKARVVRISFTSGEVNLKRSGNQDWERVRVNYPLVEGDTVATSDHSRLEIQVDARNFVRLTANTVLRIVTLRDEGVALSVVDGTAVVRLARFDRNREYFEIDAPKTTMTAEKTGLYRIDVPREGRVRLTVRDGGSARIYSDTAGFPLRDGRSAELGITGSTAGDWEFPAETLPDDFDMWVTSRENHLASQLKHNVEYYDEYIWGAEELNAYGDWSYTNDFGWIWRPRSVVLATYTDWAPYRYGHWAWVPPYGWTWIGYESWGWAPYHYGRWVYHNNGWAWVPRSKFQKNRSWWRPALVAFVFDFSFGNDICWYPLSYYQRDPHSRRYRHEDRRPNYGGPNRGGPNDRRPGYDRPWRGVTRVPRREFGNSDGRGRGVEEPLARRVVDSEPRRDLPRREPVAGNSPGAESDAAPGRPVRRIPAIEIPGRPTGAAERAPGVALDEELRRSRIFHGRDPRPTEPTETTTTPATETRPTGAVNRPEPSGPGRVGRPAPPDGIERRERNRGGVGSGPETPEPRNEQPVAPVAEPRPESQPVPASPQPRVEPRAEPGAEPRVEPRAEPRSEPRSESPRSQPRSEPREYSRPQPKFERQELPRPEPRSEPRRSESPRSESPRSESPRSESPRSESPRSESPRSESPRTESPRTESPKKPDNH